MLENKNELTRLEIYKLIYDNTKRKYGSISKLSKDKISRVSNMKAVRETNYYYYYNQHKINTEILN